nr:MULTISPECIES: hypothetical protein [Rhodococcus]
MGLFLVQHRAQRVPGFLEEDLGAFGEEAVELVPQLFGAAQQPFR